MAKAKLQRLVFHNGAYVGGGSDVVTQLRQQLPAGGAHPRSRRWRCDPRYPAAARTPAQRCNASRGQRWRQRRTRFFGGVGAPFPRSPTRSSSWLRSAASSHGNTAVIETVRHRGVPMAVCTIYDPRYPDAVRRRVGATALCVINDAIIREAATAGVPIIDLRLVCDEDEDFANPIEPPLWRLEDRRRDRRARDPARFRPGAQRDPYGLTEKQPVLQIP